ncbi:MAG: DUF3501 family protein [Ignavibacteria bacterium]|nr:DUF3501 family protein [Ignavibacteria bacterium]
MNKIAYEDIRDIAAYEKIRPEFRRRIIAVKASRRMPVGDRMTLLFENRDTVLFQIQEMMRVERIVHEAAIRHEIDTYNHLVPGELQLCVTMFIDVSEATRIKEVLDSFVGLPQDCVWIDVDGERVPAVFDLEQSTDTRVSAVQYLTFTFTSGQARRFMDASVPAALRVEHPNYRHVVPVDGELRDSLIADLRA